MPQYIAMGMSKDEFMHSTPKILNAYRKGYEIKIQNFDKLMWQFCGNYMLSAVIVAIDKTFSGKKSRAKYIEKPLIDFERKKNDEMSIEQQRQAFIQKMQTMKVNFDSQHKKEKSEHEKRY